MILAAGLGTRLRPLTNDRPKALVEVAGRTMLELTIERLRSVGVDEIIVNTHHFSVPMRSYIEQRDWGMRVEISEEDTLLDTGGGLKQAARFFLDGSEEPFLVHNVDVLSNIDLPAMVQFHCKQNALATLAVQQRSTSRYLLFEDDELCGRRAGSNGIPELARPVTHPEALAFCGIHVLSPRIFTRISEEGAFSIINAYLRLAGDGEKIAAFRADGYEWRDLGKPESVERAGREIREGLFGL